MLQWLCGSSGSRGSDRVGHCVCVVRLSGVGCWQSDQPSMSGAVDRFEDASEPGALWDMIYGGSLDTGCGQVGTGNALYFDGGGRREARTVPLDLQHIKYVNFHAHVGSSLRLCVIVSLCKEKTVTEYAGSCILQYIHLIYRHEIY